MNPTQRRELTRDYKQTPRPMGIFRVRHRAAARSLVGRSVNLPGTLNRQRFQLEHGSHGDRELQREWQVLGASAFDFEVLDCLEAKDDPTYDPAEDLEVLEQIWIEKLAAVGERFYPRSGKPT